MLARAVIISALVAAASQAAAQGVLYDASPRIIHVPQPQAYQVPQPRAYQVPRPQAYATAPSAAPMMESDDEIIERIERKKQQARRPFAKSAPAPRERAETPTPQDEQKAEPKRSMLSAPSAAVGTGSLTPIYPTPRWGNADPPAVKVENDDAPQLGGNEQQ